MAVNGDASFYHLWFWFAVSSSHGLSVRGPQLDCFCISVLAGHIAVISTGMGSNTAYRFPGLSQLKLQNVKPRARFLHKLRTSYYGMCKRTLRLTRSVPLTSRNSVTHYPPWIAQLDRFAHYALLFRTGSEYSKTPIRKTSIATYPRSGSVMAFQLRTLCPSNSDSFSGSPALYWQ